MDDLREKVIRGLECMVQISGKGCKECKYTKECDGSIATMYAGTVQMTIDALSLLKAQEPRVMTPEEVAAVPDGGVIWEEIRLTGICEAMIRDSNTFANGADFLVLDEVLDCDDYLKNYRCWTSRPTDEQREAVKWDE